MSLRERIFNERGDNRKAGITWGQRIGREECPYMCRWVLNFGLGSIRVHHWYRSDDARALHDHPWWFVTLVLKGGYTDIHSTGACVACDELRRGGSGQRCSDPACVSGQVIGTDHLSAPTIRYRPALHAHTVQVDEGGCWTIMLTGRHMRDWGFWVDGTWKRMRLFFREHGHHPCEDR